ncbi:hypothetical protein [Azospirillum rugosum]|uniref:Lipoprotein n=1 Tax=Azospirillum rugosum TaxID=416170 RepID=A0ABS4SU35_9PROT|nr:hypothetical protein [Azospirillum rugosum]MBP2296076.1 hypothetical protein [Azospirillum rugosum]MDQ0530757.1 hypothetical protein [Azospirillum rugosum]
MNRPIRVSFALVLLAASACAPLGSTDPSGVLERVADGDYDVGIRYPSKRTRYVMIVDSDDETLALTNRPAGRGQEDASPEPAQPAAPQRNDRVLAPCGEGTGNWYRHTPAGYVCAAAPGAGG